ncbi:flagellar biosynthesis protein FlhF [Streptomyces peucetius]|nr:hypothetical protein CGZ69_00100 [Streptomyces peucetius subsp. caesius ATCC 27952]
MWLWWDGYLPTRQAQRAWATWVGRGRRSQEVAREGAVGLLRQVGHQLATETARTRFVRIITELGNGKALTVRGRAELLDAVRDVMEPESVFAASRLVRALGPAQAPMTVDAVVMRIEALCAALGRTLDGKVDGALLERARAAHRAPMADYLAERGDLAAEPTGPPLSRTHPPRAVRPGRAAAPARPRYGARAPPQLSMTGEGCCRGIARPLPRSPTRSPVPFPPASKLPLARRRRGVGSYGGATGAMRVVKAARP